MKETKTKYLERIKAFRLMDDDFMSKCFENEPACTELLLHIVLERKDIQVERVETQHQLKNLQGRSVILDIYAKDEMGKRYNIEVQRASHGAGAKRARYHSSLMDANLAEAGEAHEALLEMYVIFITETDVMKGGLPLYYIERIVKETGEPFSDEAHIIYVNGAYQGEDAVGYLMHDFRCTEAKEMHYELLRGRVRYFKEEEEGQKKMSGIMEELINEKVNEKLDERNKEIAVDLLKTKELSYEKIAEIAGLSLEEVRALASVSAA